MAKKLTFLDQAFGFTESDNSPKHVAGLHLLQMPKNASKNYLNEFVKKLRTFDKAVSPFNSVAVMFLGFPLRLKEEEKLDIDYHIKEHELEDISDKEKLHQFAARLHESRLSLDKPLWQCHLIKSRKGRKFAIYMKIHHMYGDGFTLVKWLQAALSENIDTENFKPIWAKEHPRKKRKPPKSTLISVLKGILGFFLAVKDFIWICFRVLLKLLRINKTYMPVPFTGTKTVLTGQVKKGRVVSTTDLAYNRVHKLSKRLRASINEVLLCSFDIATHRFLTEYGQTFDKALLSNIPINLRKPGDDSSGNKLAILPIELAHGQKDPYLRMREIIENHRAVIRATKRSHPGSFSYYTVFIQFFALIYEVLHLSNLVHPIANILVSNIPGPRKSMYFDDSKVLAVYPISTITPGGGINITLMTYDETVNIGIVCCDNDIKSLDPLAQYFHEAFELLEKCVDDPTVNIDDIGEQVIKNHPSEVVEHQPYTDAPNHQSDH
ncbi:MAG: DUF1298 domain-containing protein [Gammaproteobacteria bacterium]|nr:DUF1298 domain-containing protein [Gammaproteobacteria bacterium]